MNILLTIVHVFVCLFLVGVVLLQSGRAWGMGVLVVRDFSAPGATLGACAGALRSAGAARVVALTAARVRLGGVG